MIHIHIIQITAFPFHILASNKIDTGPRRCLKCKTLLRSQYSTGRHRVTFQPDSVFELCSCEVILENLPCFPFFHNTFNLYASPHAGTSLLCHTHILFIRNRNCWHSSMLCGTEFNAIARLHIASDIVDMDLVSLAGVIRTCNVCHKRIKSGVREFLQKLATRLQQVQLGAKRATASPKIQT